MNQFKRIILTLSLLTAVAGLAACSTTVSQGVAADGSGAQTLLWPSPEDTNAVHPGGTWPTLDRIDQLRAGLNKPQIRALIGAPHFQEGVVGVREWNYVFHLRNPATDEVRLCQLKILFDTDMIARSYYWHPQGCNQFNAPEPQTLLTVSALFAFDRYDMASIKSQGRAQLQQIVGELKQRVADGGHIRVNGYAGPIGSDAYNRVLSQQRAETVRAYFISQGVPAGAIEARGHGSTQAGTNCSGLADGQLKACYAPERRVEIVAAGSAG